MKNYIQPKIMIVKLDIKQAIVQACMLAGYPGGFYFNVAGTQCVGGLTTISTPTYCLLDVKGVKDSTRLNALNEPNMMPS